MWCLLFKYHTIEVLFSACIEQTQLQQKLKKTQQTNIKTNAVNFQHFYYYYENVMWNLCTIT